MNSNFDRMNGMYGVVPFAALTELSRLWNKSSKGQNARQGLSWKRVVLVLAAIAMPVALLLANGLGS